MEYSKCFKCHRFLSVQVLVDVINIKKVYGNRACYSKLELQLVKFKFEYIRKPICFSVNKKP